MPNHAHRTMAAYETTETSNSRFARFELLISGIANFGLADSGKRLLPEGEGRYRNGRNEGAVVVQFPVQALRA